MATDHLAPAAHGVPESHATGACGLLGQRLGQRPGHPGTGSIGEVGRPVPPAQERGYPA
jgi:hypothetical protein